MHLNISLKITRKTLLLLIISCILAFPEKNASSADLNGTWIHHQRQAPQKNISSIFTLPDGKLWVATETYLTDMVRTFHIFDGIKWQKITYHTDKLGYNPPFICDSEGCFYFINKEWNLVKLDYKNTNDPIIVCAPDSLFLPVVGAFSEDGKILYIGSYNATFGGIYKFDGTSITKIKNGRTRSLAVDYSGRLWATHKDSTTVSLLVLDGDDWSDKTNDIKSTKPENFSDLTVQISPDSSVWVNNLGKYGIYKNGKWTFHNAGEGPMFLSFNNSGEVWGYNNHNLYKLNEDNTWITSLSNMSMSNMPNFLAVTPDSTVWTSVSQNIYRYTNNQEQPWMIVESNLDMASDNVTCMAYTYDGRLVCGHGMRIEDYLPVRGDDSERAGVSIWDGSSWNNYSEDNNESFKNVYDLLQLKNGNILAYTDDGFKIFDGDDWESQDSLYVSDGDEVDMIEVNYGTYGTVWIGTTKGILSYNFVGYAVFNDPGNEVSPWKYIPFDNLYVDNDNIVYFQSVAKDIQGGIISYIISYNNEADSQKKWEKKLSNSSDIEDFAVDDEKWVLAAKDNTIYKINGEITQDLGEDLGIGELKNASLVYIDEEDRIWASGFNNTVYIENGIWHRIPELSGTASDEYASHEDGKIALNAIGYDGQQKLYYGVFEYIPDGQSYVTEQKPNPFPTVVNYPNPFNSSTTISFSLSYPEIVKISIYNISGQKIKTLTNGEFPQGRNNVIWDSTSDSGISAASGIYFYHIETKNSDMIGKMLLLR